MLSEQRHHHHQFRVYIKLLEHYLRMSKENVVVFHILTLVLLMRVVARFPETKDFATRNLSTVSCVLGMFSKKTVK